MCRDAMRQVLPVSVDRDVGQAFDDRGLRSVAL
jgi:hypothetical protein